MKNSLNRQKESSKGYTEEEFVSKLNIMRRIWKIGNAEGKSFGAYNQAKDLRGNFPETYK